MNLAASIDQLQPDVIQRACAGDRKALDELVMAMQRPFYNLALRMLADRTLAEDATQEALLRVITHLSQYRNEAKLATWAMRIAVNAVLDARSARAREASQGFDAFSQKLALGRDDDAVEKPEDALVLKQAKTLCNRALLQCLDGEHRVAFVLGEILELSANDAADILGVQPSAYRKRLSRARAALTTALERDCSVHTAGRACACHRRLAGAVRAGALDPAALEVRIGDLAALRSRLTMLDAEARTRALYQADEQPELRHEVLASVRATLFQIAR